MGIGRAEIRGLELSNWSKGLNPIGLIPYFFWTGRERYDIEPHLVRDENFWFFFFSCGLQISSLNSAL
jgi:hypothetical protein